MAFAGAVSQTVLLALLVAVFYLISRLICNIYFHPLSSFPGSKFWTATRFTYVHSLWGGNLAQDVQALHLQYGDVIRIAPDEISFGRADAWHDVYSNVKGHPALPKSRLWHSGAPGRPKSILNALEPKDHARFRRAMESGFTERAVRTQENIIQKYVNTFISKLDNLICASDGGATVNIVRWFGFTTFDLIGDLGFGESFNCLERTEFHPWVFMIFNSLRAATLSASLRYYPGLHWLLSLAIPKSVIQKQAEHWQLAVDKVNRRLNLEKERPDLISQIKRDDEGIDGLTIPELQATASVIIVAGSETTVSVLSGTTNYLIKNPDALSVLRTELREKFSERDHISLSALAGLPYLNAVIQEGLRLCNPTPVGLPRVVPVGGATISGTFVPEGTFVNVHPLTLSLSPTYFHDPNSFRPERWMLSSSEDKSSPFYDDNHSAVQTFGVGPRSCIGKPLALAELRLILAQLIWNFDIEAADTLDGKLDWNDQRVFTVVERKPFDIRLRKKTVPILATDISPGMLEQLSLLKATGSNITSQIADMASPIGRSATEGSFSHVFSTMAIQALPEPSKEGILHQWARLLAPDGIVAIGMLDFDEHCGPIQIWAEAAMAVDLHCVSRPILQAPHWTGCQQLEEGLKEAGFRDVRSEVFELVFDIGKERFIRFFWENLNPMIVDKQSTFKG
ncbi:Cytochrome P450 monooxygenase aclL [Lachnellula suecica]|uniref:Cytochrome P450 monooxygenase aclL n=1 Tax=Lachnellula suecica TaxID=602035 RepID=A0A8T9CCX8_9HELO|nr:Cytochrome P450 monooxygenase aclL [Lachnellula suecica]